MTIRDIILQVLQVLTVICLGPLIQGVIVQFEERVQRGQGPGIFQPYRDLWKLFHKQIVIPETASWVYLGSTGRRLHLHDDGADPDSRPHQLPTALVGHG